MCNTIYNYLPVYQVRVVYNYVFLKTYFHITQYLKKVTGIKRILTTLNTVQHYHFFDGKYHVRILKYLKK